MNKLEQIAKASKEFLLWVISPVLVLIAGIVYLVSKNNQLKQDKAVLEADKKAEGQEVRVNESEKNATKLYNRYTELLNRYKAQQGGGDKPGDR